MPVIELSLARIKARARNKVSEQEILDALPFVGLDIEDQNGDTVNVEYSPNRPDFCSEAGIARSLVGLLGIEAGLPKYEFQQSQIKVSIEGEEILSVRPYIFCVYSRLVVTEEVLKQLITMQEDLHNGLGRHRSKVAIGIHNAEMIRPPIKYVATDDNSYSFVPLGSIDKQTIEQILNSTDQGREYGKILDRGLYPLLIDSSGNTLSLPPIINGELTRLKQGVRSVFVDVTATNKEAGEATIAIIASMLADIGAKVETVEILNESASTIVTPDMMPSTMKFDLNLTNDILGLELSQEEAGDALRKSRLDMLSHDQVRIPKFRTDVIHPIDLVEDVALGYGISKLRPQRRKSAFIGSITSKTRRIKKMVDVLVGLGLTEIESLSLTSRTELFVSLERNLKVDDPKSQSYEFLRSEILPSLLHVLSRSTHEEYPQRVFELGQVFQRNSSSENQILEEQHLAVAIVDSSANYSMLRSVIDAFLRLVLRSEYTPIFEPIKTPDGLFANGRAARLKLMDHSKNDFEIGTLGEISPEILHRLGLHLPVVAFEASMVPLLKD